MTNAFCDTGQNTGKSQDSEKFLESFIKYYDFSTSGRYTHEYHPFLFEKSSYSLDELEEKVETNGLPIKGRIVLTGYEEQAVPAYFTNYKVCTGSKINDEAWSKGKSGWTPQLHNKFGVMTGFLFRNIPIVNEFHASKNKEHLFDHVGLNAMPIYKKSSHIFQRHAFAGAFPIMQQAQRDIEDCMVKRDQKALFKKLGLFWKKLYQYELQCGNRKVLGTQDILFSVAHSQHIARSSVPLFRYYFGPDITYPIKVTRLQKEAATRVAQTFVQKFVTHLKPVDDKSTVYIFCSFVDGVGKSTLLGNVQNYKKYGCKFASYDPVDNSSSQLAQIYKYDEKVFIADLPAQMSHFTYKPDGLVYFDIFAANMTNKEVGAIRKFVKENNKDLEQKYKQELFDVEQTVLLNGWFDKTLYDPAIPERAFCKNLLLLRQKKANQWVPFKYNGESYLFHSSNMLRIRKLVKLEVADSLGLKNCETEQMLFLDGVRFPLPYDEFVSDLINQLKGQGVEQVVFVNFLSMYPRSSRENIRVNYLLQQMSLLYDDFDIKESLYGHYVSDAHLLHKLNHDRYVDVLDSFQKESLVRLSLYDVMNNKDLRTVDGISFSRVTKLLKDLIDKMPASSIKKIDELTVNKIKQERLMLKKLHGKTKEYINICELNFHDVVNFSRKLQKIFSYRILNDRLQSLWECPGEIESKADVFSELKEKKIKLSDTTWAELLFVIDKECKNRSLLSSIAHYVRASWYAALGNLVGGKSGAGKIIEVEKERYNVPPIWVEVMEDGKIAVFRRVFERVKEEDEEEEISDDDRKIINQLNITNALGKIQWGKIEDSFYLLSLEKARTDRNLFSFGSNIFDSGKKKTSDMAEDVSWFLSEHKGREGSEKVMTAKDLWEKLENDYMWKSRIRKVIRQAEALEKKKDGDSKKDNKKLDNKFYNSKKSNKSKKKDGQQIRLGKDEQRNSCKLFVRAIATLEMIIKDPNSEIAVRRKNHKDFVAALHLIEKVVLPTYFNIIFKDDLFNDYYSVKPLLKVEFSK